MAFLQGLGNLLQDPSVQKNKLSIGAGFQMDWVQVTKVTVSPGPALPVWFQDHKEPQVAFLLKINHKKNHCAEHRTRCVFKFTVTGISPWAVGQGDPKIYFLWLS